MVAALFAEGHCGRTRHISEREHVGGPPPALEAQTP
jgi:hypothetical protein